MTLPFGSGDNQEVFKYSLFLVSCNRLVAASIAAATLLVRRGSLLCPPAAAWHTQQLGVHVCCNPQPPHHRLGG